MAAVAGTLLSGFLQIGDKLVLLPGDDVCSVRCELPCL